METCRTHRRLQLLCLALAAALAGVAQAQDFDAHDVHAVRVKYADLDLSTLAGASTLYRRISGAARFVCGDKERGIEGRRMWESCVRATVTDAVTAVHSPVLTTLHAGAAGRATRTAQLIG